MNQSTTNENTTETSNNNNKNGKNKFGRIVTQARESLKILETFGTETRAKVAEHLPDKKEVINIAETAVRNKLQTLGLVSIKKLEESESRLLKKIDTLEKRLGDLENNKGSALN